MACTMEETTMPVAFAWIGWILTVVFGFLTLYQFLDDRALRRNILATKRILESLDGFCEKVTSSEEIMKTEAGRMFVTSVGHMVLGALNSLNTLLPDKYS